jgi:hypothetical protein
MKKLKEKIKGKQWASLKWTRGRLLVLAAFVLLLAVLLVYVTLQLFKMRDSLQFIDALSDTNSKVVSEMMLAKDFLESFGGDLNEIREYLLLPTSEYDFSELGEVSVGDEVSVSQSGLVLEFLNELGEYEENKEVYDANLNVLRAGLESDYWSVNGLLIAERTSALNERNIEFVVSDVERAGLIHFIHTLEYDGSLSAEDHLKENWSGFSEGADEDGGTFLFQVQAHLAEQVGVNRSAWDNAQVARTQFAEEELISEAFLSILTDMELVVSSEFEENNTYAYTFQNRESVTVAKLSMNWFGGEKRLTIYAPSSAFTGAAGSWVTYSVENIRQFVDGRTAIEKEFDGLEMEMAGLVLDPAFESILNSYGFSLGEVSEDELGISYPILNEDGSVLKILFLNRVSGEVQVHEPEGESESLSAAIEALDLSGKKKLWTYPNSYLSSLV